MVTYTAGRCHGFGFLVLHVVTPDFVVVSKLGPLKWERPWSTSAGEFRSPTRPYLSMNKRLRPQILDLKDLNRLHSLPDEAPKASLDTEALNQLLRSARASKGDAEACTPLSPVSLGQENFACPASKPPAAPSILSAVSPDIPILFHPMSKDSSLGSRL